MLSTMASFIACGGRQLFVSQTNTALVTALATFYLHIGVPALGMFYLRAPDLFYVHVNVIADVCPNCVLSQPLNEAAS